MSEQYIKDFTELLDSELELLKIKNRDYSLGGNPFGNFQRVGQILALYPNLKLSDPLTVLLIFTLKHLDAVLHMAEMAYDGKENKEDRLKDISLYANIAILMKRAGL